MVTMLVTSDEMEDSSGVTMLSVSAQVLTVTHQHGDQDTDTAHMSPAHGHISHGQAATLLRGGSQDWCWPGLRGWSSGRGGGNRRSSNTGNMSSAHDLNTGSWPRELDIFNPMRTSQQMFS